MLNVSAQCHWGMEDGDAGPMRGHVHTEIDLDAIPNPARGKITVPVRFVGFMNPGKIKEIDVRGRPEAKDLSDFNIKTNQDVPAKPLVFDPMETVSYDVEIEIDTRPFPYDGWQQLRIAPIVTFADGLKHEMRSILRFAVKLRNGHPYRDWIDNRTGERTRGAEGVGFYVPTGYARAAFRRPWGIVATDKLPPLEVDFAADACKRCFDDFGHPRKAPITRSEIRVDADLHHGIPGTTLWSHDGPFSGWIPELTLPELEPGEHKLLLRCEQPDTKLHSTCIGQLVVPFTTEMPL